MNMVKDYLGKKWLLDILMHFLWTNTERFTQCHLRFARDLYYDILDEIRGNHSLDEKVDYSEGMFHKFDLVCRDSAELFYFEQRIKKLEELLAQKNERLFI